MEQPPAYTVCVVNYNGERSISAVLDAVLAQDFQPETIIMVDNASTDHSVALVRQRFPTVRIVQLVSNRGPGAARNTGFQVAAQEYILFVDSDVLLDASCARVLLQNLHANPQAAAAMPRVLYACDPETIQYDGASSHYLGLMALQHADQGCHDVSCATRSISSLVTACFLLNRKRWGASEPFDERFFFDYEDHDFGLRTRVFGHTILSVAAARVHHGSGTPGLSWRTGGEQPPLRIFCLIRNRWLVVLKNYQWRSLLLISPMLAIYECSQLIGACKKGWLRIWLLAVISVAADIGTTISRRSMVQRMRTVPDRAILEGGPLPLNPEVADGILDQVGKAILDTLATRYWRLVRPWL
jgi:GT2 family glycosyltransferase